MPTSQSDSERQTAASASGSICLVAAQLREAVADRRRRHRLQPQPLDRLGGLRVLRDVAEDELALAARVAGVDERVDVLALDELQQRLQPVLVLLDRLQLELRRDRRQVRERPLAALDLLLFGHADLEQMADRRRQHVAVALEVVVVAREAAERARDVGGDGGLFGDDQRLGHRAVRREERRWYRSERTRQEAFGRTVRRASAARTRRSLRTHARYALASLMPRAASGRRAALRRVRRARARSASPRARPRRGRVRAISVSRSHGIVARARRARALQRARASRVARARARGARARAAPSSSRMSCAVSTSFAPSRMSLWQPLENGEWIDPGIANTSRPCSPASRAVMSEPERQRRLDDEHACARPLIRRLRRGKFCSQRRRAGREFGDDAAALGDRVRELAMARRIDAVEARCRRTASVEPGALERASCAARVDAEREPGDDRSGRRRDSARANARALSMPCGVALRLPTIASAGPFEELAPADEVEHRRRIGRFAAAPADSRGSSHAMSSWPGCASQSRVRASASADGRAASCAAMPSGTTPRELRARRAEDAPRGRRTRAAARRSRTAEARAARARAQACRRRRRRSYASMTPVIGRRRSAGSPTAAAATAAEAF